MDRPDTAPPRPEDDTTDSDPPTSTTTFPGAPTLDQLPNLWSAEDPWEFFVWPCGDLNGDGLDDALVRLVDEDVYGTYALIAFAPLLAPRTLPGPNDAIVSDGWLISSCRDATGDGIADLFLSSWAIDELRYFEGPIEGPVVNADAGAVHPPTFLVDLDGDAILDRWDVVDQGDVNRLEIRWGPDLWTSEWDVALQPSCEGEDFLPSTVTANSISSEPDLTGDGRRELYVGITVLRSACGPYLLPLPEAGFVDPDTEPGTLAEDFPDHFYAVVPDQTGDGLHDAWMLYQERIAASPLDFASDEWISEQDIPFDKEIGSVVPLPADTDGDGVTDFFVSNRYTHVYQVVGGGPGLSDITFDPGRPAWNLSHTWFIDVRDPFIEDGHVGVFVEWAQLNVVDLGPIAP